METSQHWNKERPFFAWLQEDVLHQNKRVNQERGRDKKSNSGEKQGISRLMVMWNPNMRLWE